MRLYTVFGSNEVNLYIPIIGVRRHFFREGHNIDDVMYYGVSAINYVIW